MNSLVMLTTNIAQKLHLYLIAEHKSRMAEMTLFALRNY